MAANQPSWPRQWLMTDERIGDRLWEAIAALPEGDGGVVFRHYSLSSDEREVLAFKVAKAAAERELVMAVAGSGRLAEQLEAALVHNPHGPTSLPFSVSVHDEAEAIRAREIGAAMMFVSPVNATRSHPGESALGPDRAAKLAGLAGCPAIALGGMNRREFDALKEAHPDIFHGFAGIDCWLP